MAQTTRKHYGDSEVVLHRTFIIHPHNLNLSDLRKMTAPVMSGFWLLTTTGGAVSGASMTWMIPLTAGMSQSSSCRWFTLLQHWGDETQDKMKENQNKIYTYIPIRFYTLFVCVYLHLTSFSPLVRVRLNPSRDMMTSFACASINGRLLWLAEMWYSRSLSDKV